MTNNRYYIDQVDGEIREYNGIIADTLQNTAAKTREEAQAIVDEAIENGDLIEITPEDRFNEETEKAYASAAMQYTEHGNYIEVVTETFGTRYWIGFDLKNGEWVPGELQQDHIAFDPKLCGCSLADVERMAEEAIQAWMDGWEESFNDAFRAAYAIDNTKGYRMLGWRFDPALKYLDVLYRTEEGLQETYLFNADGDAVGGKNLGGEDTFNSCYLAPEFAEKDGYQIEDGLRRNWRLPMMAYRLDLVEEDSTEYPQWSEIEPETRYFATSEEAEKAAADLNKEAWAAWDEAHPDATKEEKMWAADHAPSFEATEM